MNIFVLDENITQCAQYHCDQHVIKMILESVQLLCTALNKKGFVTPYKSTHTQHPCVLWVEASYDNFEWLVQLTDALNTEYRYRFDKVIDHKSIAVLRQIAQLEYARAGLTPFPQAMPEQFKVAGNAVQAYRNFYIGDKRRFTKWTKRPLPQWFADAVAVQSN
ncbi:pyrimidine dimer DNA glycosylase/endonuclease V [Shewanella sp.]|uniref:pyrimidine dimer DNA glycosylase/endonuclease V n=1 Tax=Shewanella sp. TaxID=50422 RepID=UPI003A96975A